MPAEQVDGLWRFTGYDAWQVPDRPVFLPVYKFWSAHTLESSRVGPYGDEWSPWDLPPYSIITDQPYNRFGNRYEGRVVVADHTAGSPERDYYITPDYAANSGPTDILRWHLYHGGPHQHERSAGTSAKLPQYAEFVAAMTDIAPRVKGILTGNCGPELAFHQLLCAPDQKQREWCNRKCVDFIRETGDLIAERGGTPVYMPMDREILIDCYHCESRMAEAVAEYNGIMIVCAEWAIFPRWTCIYGNADTDALWLEGDAEPHPDRQNWRDDYGVFVAWEKREPYPYPTLLDYYRRYEIWHCMGYDLDWRNGADLWLQRHGCKAVVY